MSTLSTKRRNKLPKNDFAGPNRTYPINDRAHAANAKARAQAQYNHGQMSASAKSKIFAKANRVLRGSRGS